jgi:hypothetical protein
MRTILIMMLAGLLCLACGSDGRKKDSSETPDPAANPTEAIRNVMKGLNVDGKDVDVKPVDHRKLREMLKESLRGGYERTEYESQTVGTMGFNLSNAQAKYENSDGCRLDVTITDTGGMGMAMMSMAPWTSMEMDREDKNGYEKTGTFQGHKAFEKYDKTNQSAELTLIVENRFIVAINGRKCDIDEVKKVAGDLDIGDLKKLK